VAGIILFDMRKMGRDQGGITPWAPFFKEKELGPTAMVISFRENPRFNEMDGSCLPVREQEGLLFTV